jgi:hypothetical protein
MTIIKKTMEARHQWFTPAILAIWEAEIRKMVVPTWAKIL